MVFSGSTLYSHYTSQRHYEKEVVGSSLLCHPRVEMGADKPTETSDNMTEES